MATKRKRQRIDTMMDFHVWEARKARKAANKRKLARAERQQRRVVGIGSPTLQADAMREQLEQRMWS
jgi:hypothetical protein